MKIAIAQVQQETNTFSPVPCTLKDFEENGLYYDTNFLDKMKGKAEIGAFLDVVEEEGIEVELIPILRALASSGGRIETKALEFFKEKLASGLKKALPLDGIFLSLHGAASTEKLDDMEGYLLSVVRNVVGPQIPIVVTLDHHANITKQMIELADLMVGFETQPHKPYETGKKAARLFFSLLKDEFNPVVSWQKIPMIVSIHERLNTAEGEAMKEWFDLARELEKKSGVISISNFPMQPWLDVKEAGLSTLVYTNDKPEFARELAAKLANKAWELRERFYRNSDRLSPEEAIKHAVEAKEGPILLSDPADDVLAGAPGDSTYLLKEMLRQEITCTALIPMYDPEVYHQAVQAGMSSEITVKVGGKSDSVFSKPVQVTGKVTGISSGFEVALMKGGKQPDPLPFPLDIQHGTIILEVGNIILLISESRFLAGIHSNVYRHFGIEPAEAKIIVMKTGTYFQYYESIMKELIMVDCPGVSQADLTQFEWVRAPHPIYPMDKDRMNNWQADPSVKN